MLSNAYFLAKIRFDTAENEPAKNLQNFANVPNFPEAARKKLGSADRGPVGQLAGLFDSAKQDTSREQAVVLQVVVPLANIAPRGEALHRAR